MKVCLRKGYHSVFEDLIKYPPKGVEYVFPPYVVPSKNKIVNNIKRGLFRSYLRFTNNPHALKVNPMGAELIHGCSGILVKNDMPWVLDLEHAASFVGFQAGRLENVRKKVEKYLAGKNCKKIMPWTEAGKMSILNGLDCSGFKEKLEVVYPAIAPRNVAETKSDSVRFLFVSYGFYIKGGMEVLKAFETLSKKYDVELTMISDVPKDIVEKYSGKFKVKFPGLQPREKVLTEFFPNSDVFILPTYTDTFGMVFLEAMAAGKPCIGTDTFAVPEIIGNCGFALPSSKYSWYGKNYLFSMDNWEKFNRFVETTEKPEIVSGIIEKAGLLIQDSKLRRKLGETGLKEVVNGKFSIKARNEQLLRIYREAVE
ncbi:MAG: glycosyltransferase family 4 protein [Candidatus Aenigmarchaeota archaeon]|nr:glycosyltransferase family 4 protein [Candidatus Aenigmarchaeota archaeon]